MGAWDGGDVAGRSSGRLAALCALVALVLAAATPVAAQSNIPGLNVVTETRVVGDETRTRFIADLTEETELTVFALSDLRDTSKLAPAERQHLLRMLENLHLRMEKAAA